MARQIMRLRYTGAYEIRALALGKAGRPGAALAALQRGAARAPQAWIIQMMLGNALSDFGRYDEAVEAYKVGRGLVTDPYDQVLIEANHAHALYRAGRAPAAVDKAAWCLETCRANGIEDGLHDFVLSVHADSVAKAAPRRRRLFSWRR